MKKKIILTISIIVVYFFIYKAWNLLIYTQDKSLYEYSQSIIETYKNKETINIEFQKVTNKITFKNLEMNNIFNDYKKIQKNTDEIQFIKNDGKNINKYIIIGNSKSFLEIFTDGFKKYDEKIILYDKDKMNIYLKENNITDDLKLFNYLLDNYSNSTQLLTSSSKMKENYYIKEYIRNVIPKIKNIYIFDNKDGYMLKLNSGAYEIHIDEYVITIVGLTKEEIISLVRTININEK